MSLLYRLACLLDTLRPSVWTAAAVIGLARRMSPDLNRIHRGRFR